MNSPSNSIGKDVNIAVKIFFVTTLFGNFIALIVSYIRINYFSASLYIGQLSISEDKIGYLPELVQNSARYSVGNHFFGDFLEPFLKTASRAPYTELLPGHRASNYPPFAQALFYPSTWIPYHSALAVYLGISLLSIVIPTWLLLQKINKSASLTTTLGFALSLPVLFCLDRGNLWGIAIGLILMSIYFVEDDQVFLASICLGLATAIKIFPIVLFIWLWKKCGPKSPIAGLISGFVISIISMFSFKGSIGNNFSAFIASQRFVHANIDENFMYQRVNNSVIALANNLNSLNVMPLKIIGEFFIRDFWFLCSLLLALSILLIRKMEFNKKTEILIFGLLVNSIFVLSPTTFFYGYVLFLILLVNLVTYSKSDTGLNVLGFLIGILFVNKVPFSPIEAIVTGMNTVNPLVSLAIEVLLLNLAIKEIKRAQLKTAEKI